MGRSEEGLPFGKGEWAKTATPGRAMLVESCTKSLLELEVLESKPKVLQQSLTFRVHIYATRLYIQVIY